MFKRFLMRKMLSKQLKEVPEKEQEKILDAIEKNPEFFKKIGKEIQAEVKKGKSQQVASMEVMRKHQADLQKILGQ